MPLDIDPRIVEFIGRHRVARLATASATGEPSVVPICYVLDEENVYTPVDEKPKSVDAGSLKRIRNIRTNAHVALVVDEYSEDWNELVYVLIKGTAEILNSSDNAAEHAHAVALLREKYQQYRSMRLDDRPIIKIKPSRIKRWAPVDKGEAR